MGAHEAAIMLIVNHVKRAFIDARVLMPDGSDALTADERNRIFEQNALRVFKRLPAALGG